MGGSAGLRYPEIAVDIVSFTSLGDTETSKGCRPNSGGADARLNCNSAHRRHGADSIHAVDVKLPPLWTSDLELWFVQVESTFAAERIAADQTKFHNGVSSLFHLRHPMKSARLLLAPQSTNAYKALRELLISRFTPAGPQRLNELPYGAELGDHRRPQPIVAPRGTTTPRNDQPANVSTVIASSVEKQLSQLAELADVVVAAVPLSIVATHRHAGDRASVDELNDMLQQISQLGDTVTALQRGNALAERHRTADFFFVSIVVVLPSDTAIITMDARGSGDDEVIAAEDKRCFSFRC
ncbi:hypothetical protein HPB50_012401 [Hyalomma asiaticum]|uniref:Uncharacterized protein n=1 Tax=Hyalomma asiaticum TaxID=266040 RepID=A0ACB7T4J8_HYAAI|nr:hypothetical protein HPB50_012401 [Hyalomma asiaticum]